MEKNTLSFFFLENNNQIINGINKTIIKSYLIKKKKKLVIEKGSQFHMYALLTRYLTRYFNEDQKRFRHAISSTIR